MTKWYQQTLNELSGVNCCWIHPEEKRRRETTTRSSLRYDPAESKSIVSGLDNDVVVCGDTSLVGFTSEDEEKREWRNLLPRDSGISTSDIYFHRILFKSAARSYRTDQGRAVIICNRLLLQLGSLLMIGALDYATLPQVVLVDIFSRLTSAELLAASSTCSSWRQIFYHPQLWLTKPYRCLRLTLLDRQHDIYAFRYLTTQFLSMARYIELRFDPTQLSILRDVLQLLDLLVCTNRQVKILIFRPLTTRCAFAEHEQPLIPLCDK